MENQTLKGWESGSSPSQQLSSAHGSWVIQRLKTEKHPIPIWESNPPTGLIKRISTLLPCGMYLTWGGGCKVSVGPRHPNIRAESCGKTYLTCPICAWLSPSFWSQGLSSNPNLRPLIYRSVWTDHVFLSVKINFGGSVRRYKWKSFCDYESFKMFGPFKQKLSKNNPKKDLNAI